MLILIVVVGICGFNVQTIYSEEAVQSRGFLRELLQDYIHQLNQDTTTTPSSLFNFWGGGGSATTTSTVINNTTVSTTTPKTTTAYSLLGGWFGSSGNSNVRKSKRSGRLPFLNVKKDNTQYKPDNALTSTVVQQALSNPSENDTKYIKDNLQVLSRNNQEIPSGIKDIKGEVSVSPKPPFVNKPESLNDQIHTTEATRKVDLPDSHKIQRRSLLIHSLESFIEVFEKSITTEQPTTETSLVTESDTIPYGSYTKFPTAVTKIVCEDGALTKFIKQSTSWWPTYSIGQLFGATTESPDKCDNEIKIYVTENDIN